MTHNIPYVQSNDPVEILTEVAKHILAEPLRYNQGIWVDVIGDRWSAGKNYPACGTIACVAGWVVTLKGQRNIRGFTVSNTASELLKLTDAQDSELFDGDAIIGVRQRQANRKAGYSEESYTSSYDVERILGTDHPQVGTPEYALAGAQHIRDFVKKHYNKDISKEVGIE